MSLKWLRLVPPAVATVIALCTLAAVAQAQPKIIQTDCDTLSVNPPLVRVTFGVANLGGPPVCSLRLTPIQSGGTPADSCRILQCSYPPGWTCQADSATGRAYWVTQNCIQEGDKHDGFDVVLDPLFCCYLAEYDDASGNIFYTETVCFECDKPVPIRNSTWGYLKIQYR